MHFAHAPLPEINIADRQGFVNQQDFRIDVNGYREGQPHDHAARVSLDRLIDEVANFRERLDLGEALVHFLAREPKDRAV